jgi:hypothetical protein
MIKKNGLVTQEMAVHKVKPRRVGIITFRFRTNAAISVISANLLRPPELHASELQSSNTIR